MNIKFDERNTGNLKGDKPRISNMYIVLLVGMLMMSVISLALTFKTYSKYNKESYNKYAKNINEQQEENALPVKSNVEKTEEKDTTEKASVEDLENEDTEVVLPTVSKVEPVKKENVLSFSAPVSGKIIKESSIDEVVYWETLDVWKIHEGIDIASEEGTAVKAIEAGKVVSVKTDPIFGKLVIINHGQTVLSIYCNLDENVPVKEGSTVKKGQTIGKVGKTAYGEIKEESHLHFEMMKDSVYIDPTNYIEFN